MRLLQCNQDVTKARSLLGIVLYRSDILSPLASIFETRVVSDQQTVQVQADSAFLMQILENTSSATPTSYCHEYLPNVIQEEKSFVFYKKIKRLTMKRKKTENIQVISLFSGCGGMDLGFKTVPGFEIIRSVDTDQNGCDSIEKNKYISNCVERVDDMMDCCFFPGEAQVLILQPECATRRCTDSSTPLDGNSWSATVRAISIIQPSVVVLMINNLVSSVRPCRYVQEEDEWVHFGDTVHSTLSHLGYHADFCVLDAVDYGVAQTRQKTIIIGRRRSDTALLQHVDMHAFPSLGAFNCHCCRWRLNKEYAENSLLSFCKNEMGGYKRTEDNRRCLSFIIDESQQDPEWYRDRILMKSKTAGEVLRSLPRPGLFPNGGLCAALIKPLSSPVLRGSAFAGMLFNGSGRPVDLSEPCKTLHRHMGGNYTPIVDQRHIDNPDILPWYVCYYNRLKCVEHVQKKRSKSSARNAYMPTPPDHVRRLTVTETKLLTGFSHAYSLMGTVSSQFRQVGGSVSPPLARAIALYIRYLFT
jgi:site-specific DNA-cytosine methylase